jgi:hypothetical protein
MQKITGISSCKNNKSCGLIYHEPNKISFAFFRFFYNFYAIYKKQAIHFTIGVTVLQGGPRKDLWFRNVAPGRGRSARVAGIRRARRRSWPGKGWGGAYGPLGSYLGTGSVGRGGR